MPYHKNTQFILSNLSLINPRNFCEARIDYSPLEDFDLDLFYAKISKLDRLSLRKGLKRVKEAGKLLQFVERTKPDYLEMRICKMSESFLNELHRFRCIRSLRLYLARMRSIANLDFVFQMKNLMNLCGYEFFSFAFLVKLVSQTECLTNISFVFNSFVVMVRLINHSEYTLWLSNSVTGRKPDIQFYISPQNEAYKGAKFSNRTELVDFLKEAEPRLDGRPLNEICKLLEPKLGLTDLVKRGTVGI